MVAFNNDILNSKKHLHFIGIGGSGMFPLAQILHSKGFYITGSDVNESDIVNLVRGLGITVHMGHHAENIGDADLIVHTAAVMQDNPELVAARERGITVLERSELFGIITQQFSDCICICGTHGKTSTTSMITQVLFENGKDPSAVIGGKLPIINGYGRVGDSDTIVCEACEFADTFLRLAPDTAIILNIDADHLEYFKTMENLIHSFHRFAEMATKTVIVNGDDANSLKAIEGIHGKEIVRFGFSDSNDYYAENIESVTNPETHARVTCFDMLYRGTLLGKVTLNVAGLHNVSNAIAAMTAAMLEGIEFNDAAESLRHFHGAGRRLEILGTKNGITVADDYAHHPAELKCTLEAVKTLGYREIWAVFQPFTFSRTAMLLDDFAEVLRLPDHVVLSPIMGSREINTYGIHTKDLGDRIEGSVCLETFEEIAEYVMSHAQEGDLVITLGCGDIYKAAKIMLK